MAPDELTRQSILMQGVDEDGSRHYLAAVYSCSCWNRGDEWSICQYHKGFDDGVEAERLRLRYVMKGVYEYLPEDVCCVVRDAL